MTGQILVAKETFTADLNGAPVTVHKGKTRVREGHPLLEGREDLFEPIDVHFDVEETTKEPGKSRRKSSTGRQAKAD